jgi:hypothetical protein
MEAASENTPVDKKRGRPRKFDYTKLCDPASPSSARTIRGRQNTEYALQAFMTLTMARDEKPEHREWIQPLLENMRPSVFAELGRCTELDDPTVFWKCVAYLRDNPSVSAKEAIAVIRRARLEEAEQMDSGLRLHDALIATINKHLARYPETEPRSVAAALRMTIQAVENMEAASEKQEAGP